MRHTLAAVALIVFGFSNTAIAADLARILRRLEGWTIIHVDTIDGSWEGCDYGRLIKLSDGSVLKCSSYGYSYAYRPDAIVLGKSATLGGRSFLSIKLFVENEVYDMEPIIR